MNILVLSHAFPCPPRDGDTIPIYHFLRCLAPRVRYRLLTIAPYDRDQFNTGRRLLEGWGIEVETVEPSPRSRPAQVLSCLIHGRPWINRFYSAEFAAATANALARGGWDVVQAEGILSAQHLPRRIGLPSVLIARDCLSLRHRRQFELTRAPGEFLQSLKIGWMERSLFPRFDQVLAISPVDQAAMRRLSGGTAVGLLPNGVDLDDFRPQPECEESETVVFTGKMDYPPNADAAVYFTRRIWPLVRRRRPAARFLIVGRDPTEAVRALAAEPGVTVTGAVERIQDWSARAAVIVSPLRFGTGLKNKILEAAAMGRAIVATPESLEGLDFEPERELVIADREERFADDVADLLADPARRRSLGDAARRRVESQYSWSAMAERLWACYQDLVAGNPPKGCMKRA